MRVFLNVQDIKNDIETLLRNEKGENGMWKRKKWDEWKEQLSQELGIQMQKSF